jgi:hypothetical protein
MTSADVAISEPVPGALGSAYMVGAGMELYQVIQVLGFVMSDFGSPRVPISHKHAPQKPQLLTSSTYHIISIGNGRNWLPLFDMGKMFLPGF